MTDERSSSTQGLVPIGSLVKSMTGRPTPRLVGGKSETPMPSSETGVAEKLTPDIQVGTVERPHEQASLPSFLRTALDGALKYRPWQPETLPFEVIDAKPFYLPFAAAIREAAVIPSDPKTREKWLASLGLLCAATAATDGSAEQKVKVLGQMLADIPDFCFTKATLETIAAQNRFFPAYADLRETFAGWVSAAKNIAARLEKMHEWCEANHA